MNTHTNNSLPARLCVMLAMLAAVSAAHATDPTTQKLFGKWTSASPTGFSLGDGHATTALSAKWAVVGAPNAKDRGAGNEGAVQVFNAVTGRELALFMGDANQCESAALHPLRRPVLKLRKGQLFDNQPSKIRSILLPTTSITASGAGGTGRGRAVSTGIDIFIIVEYDNGVRQILRG
jgi:hypothetical protein